MNALHVGCGGAPLPSWLEGYDEVRLDIDERHKPDIVADMRALGEIGQFDVVYSSHSLEHLYPHDGRKALAEFYRVLVPNGRVIVIVPNLEGIKANEDVVYESPSGPITGLDMIYGARWLIEAMPYMAHKNGFTKLTLEAEMKAAGFDPVSSVISNYNLISIGVKAQEKVNVTQSS